MIRDTAVVGIASVIVAVAVVFRERVIASSFGIGDITDAFALASAIVVFIATVIGGSLAVALIPALMRIEIESGPAATETLCRAVLARLLLGLSLVAAVVYLLSEPIMSIAGRDFSSEKRQLTRVLLEVMLPLLPLAGWVAYATTLLNARRRFLFATMAPAVIPVAVVVVLQISSTPKALASGMVLGYLLQCLTLALVLSEERSWLMPKWSASPSDLGMIWRQYIPVTIGAAFMGSTVVTDQVMAGWLEPGSVATLAFASVLVNYLNAFGGRVLGAPALSHFSRLTAQKRWAEAGHLMWQGLLIISGVAVGLTAILWIFSDWFVAQLFERGAFTNLDTIRVAEVQKYFALQLTFQFTGVLLVRMLSALEKNEVILVVAAFNFFANIVLNYVFMKFLGVAGIALSTSIVLCVSALLCGATVWRSLNAAPLGKRRL